MAEMEIRTLDCHGSQFPGCGFTGFLIDGRTLLDAWAATSVMTLEEQSQMDHVLISHAHLDHIREPASLADNLCYILRNHPLTVISTPQVIEKTLKKFLHQGSEILVFHVLTHEELQFPFKHLSIFQDMETGNRILLQPAFLQTEYVARMKQYLAEVKRICHRYKISYQLLETRNSFDVALREFLVNRARMH